MKPSLFIFSAANVIGILLIFDAIACIIHQATQEERNYYDFGDSITFLVMTVPVLLMCSLLNVCWAVMALVNVVKRRDYRDCIALGVTLSIWGLMVCEHIIF